MTRQAQAHTAEDWLKHATGLLEASGIATGRLDALVLLEDATGTDRSWLLAHPDHELTTEVINLLNSLLARRAAHEPLAYIRGKTEFYGRDFSVNHDVLEPRPESETMIELFKKLGLPNGARVADVGTGSGALGITAFLEKPGCHVDLIDIDERCLAVARQNADKHDVEARFVTADLLDGAPAYDVILANLPYVPRTYGINMAASHEPSHAIFGGEDGLDLYRTMFAQLKDSADKPMAVLAESLPFQHKPLAHIARSAGFALEHTDDFIQLFKPL